LFNLETKQDLPILEYSEVSGLGRIMRANFRKSLPNLSTVFTAHNAFLLKSMALSGKGIAWLPRTLVATELQNGQLQLAGGDPWQLPIEIRLYRQSAPMSQIAEDVWKFATT